MENWRLDRHGLGRNGPGFHRPRSPERGLARRTTTALHGRLGNIARSRCQGRTQCASHSRTNDAWPNPAIGMNARNANAQTGSQPMAKRMKRQNVNPATANSAARPNHRVFRSQDSTPAGSLSHRARIVSRRAGSAAKRPTAPRPQNVWISHRGEGIPNICGNNAAEEQGAGDG